jgi:hypothetical protein
VTSSVLVPGVVASWCLLPLLCHALESRSVGASTHCRGGGGRGEILFIKLLGVAFPVCI